MRIAVLAFMVLVLPGIALAQGQAPPTADQSSNQLCDMNRVQGERNAGAIIAANLKVIADLRVTLCPTDPTCDLQATAAKLRAASVPAAPSKP